MTMRTSVQIELPAALLRRARVPVQEPVGRFRVRKCRSNDWGRRMTPFIQRGDVFWASEVFDPGRPDTQAMGVLE